MKLYNSTDRSKQNSADLHAFFGSCFLELRLELKSNASDAVYGQLLMSVNGDVALDKQAESLDEQVVNGRMAAVFDDDGNERSQEGVGGRKAINALNNVRQLQFKPCAECFF